MMQSSKELLNVNESDKLKSQKNDEQEVQNILRLILEDDDTADGSGTNQNDSIKFGVIDLTSQDDDNVDLPFDRYESIKTESITDEESEDEYHLMLEDEDSDVENNTTSRETDIIVQKNSVDLEKALRLECKDNEVQLNHMDNDDVSNSDKGEQQATVICDLEKHLRTEKVEEEKINNKSPLLTYTLINTERNNQDTIQQNSSVLIANYCNGNTLNKLHRFPENAFLDKLVQMKNYQKLENNCKNCYSKFKIPNESSIDNAVTKDNLFGQRCQQQQNCTLELTSEKRFGFKKAQELPTITESKNIAQPLWREIRLQNQKTGNTGFTHSAPEETLLQWRAQSEQQLLSRGNSMGFGIKHNLFFKEKHQQNMSQCRNMFKEGLQDYIKCSTNPTTSTQRYTTLGPSSGHTYKFHHLNNSFLFSQKAPLRFLMLNKSNKNQQFPMIRISNEHNYASHGNPFPKIQSQVGEKELLNESKDITVPPKLKQLPFRTTERNQSDDLELETKRSRLIIRPSKFTVSNQDSVSESTHEDELSKQFGNLSLQEEGCPDPTIALQQHGDCINICLNLPKPQNDYYIKFASEDTKLKLAVSKRDKLKILPNTPKTEHKASVLKKRNTTTTNEILSDSLEPNKVKRFKCNKLKDVQTNKNTCEWSLAKNMIAKRMVRKETNAKSCKLKQFAPIEAKSSQKADKAISKHYENATFTQQAHLRQKIKYRPVKKKERLEEILGHISKMSMPDLKTNKHLKRAKTGLKKYINTALTNTSLIGKTNVRKISDKETKPQYLLIARKLNDDKEKKSKSTIQNGLQYKHCNETEQKPINRSSKNRVHCSLTIESEASRQRNSKTEKLETLKYKNEPIILNGGFFSILNSKQPQNYKITMSSREELLETRSPSCIVSNGTTGGVQTIQVVSVPCNRTLNIPEPTHSRKLKECKPLFY